MACEVQDEDEDLVHFWGEESTEGSFGEPVAGEGFEGEVDEEDLAAGNEQWEEVPEEPQEALAEDDEVVVELDEDDGEWAPVADDAYGGGNAEDLGAGAAAGDDDDAAWAEAVEDEDVAAAGGDDDAVWEEDVAAAAVDDDAAWDEAVEQVEATDAAGVPAPVEEGLAWDGDEAEAAALEVVYETLNEENKQDGAPEEALLALLRKGFSNRLFHGRKFHLEPFGSYVTDLGLPNSEGSGRSDLDVVLLFHGHRADSFEVKEVRRNLVSPTIDQLAAFLRRERGITLKNVVPKARVPIVTFETQDLSVDISVQQPWGVLNSWHLRDLCASGWPGRLRALARLVKLWAKSKAIHTAKDGALSSYGYVMLVTSFLQDCGGVPALRFNRGSGPYLDSDSALRQVLDACSRDSSNGAAHRPRPTQLWRAPEVLDPSASDSPQATAKPAELFSAWLDWMADVVFAFLADETGSVGQCPLEHRHIVSVRGRTQEELRADVTWSPKRGEHWSPGTSEVFMLIEEPLNGENVARCVRLAGLQAIHKEVCRARDFFKAEPLDEQGLPPFEALLKLKPLSTRQAPPVSLGLGAGMPRPLGAAGYPRPQGQKRPLPQAVGAPQEPPTKRPVLTAFGAQARARAQHAAAAANGARPPLWAGGARPGAPAMMAHHNVLQQRPAARMPAQQFHGAAPWGYGGCGGPIGGCGARAGFAPMRPRPPLRPPPQHFVAEAAVGWPPRRY